MSAVRLQITRPFASVEELIDSDAWAIDRQRMRLFTEEAIDVGGVVRFEVHLSNGERVLFGEGEVEAASDTDPRPADGEPEPGFWIRFKRFDMRTKEILKQALLSKREKRRSAAKGPAPEPPSEVSVAEPEPPSEVDVAMPADAEATSETTTSDAVAATDASGGEAPESSPKPVVKAPANRDDLLARLRKRAQESPDSVAKAVESKKSNGMGKSIPVEQAAEA